MLAVVIDKYDNFLIENIRAMLQYIDVIEIRFDYWEILDITKVKALQQLLSIPMIFTLRSRAQGVHFRGSEEERFQEIYRLASLKPAYFDIEYNVPQDIIHYILTNFPSIKLIGSYYNFIETPNNLDEILNLLKKKPFHIYKIATYANNTLDALRMLTFVKESSKCYNLIGICMGHLGSPTRILGKIVGNMIDYTTLDNEHESVLGQISLNLLLQRYNYQNLNNKTSVYALLGHPVESSIGDIFHNNAFQLLYQNAVYIKLNINKYELESAIVYLKKLPFKGFSITMPLKEVAFKLVDYIDNDANNIQAINSIVVKDKGKYYGFNTDGRGAAASLINKGQNLNNKKVLILGAGGAAKAIIYEMNKLGANIIVFNRTGKKAEAISKFYGCSFYQLNKFNKIAAQGYDIIINTIPVDACIARLVTSQSFILPECWAMDINYYLDIYKDTPFLKMIPNEKGKTINGYDMFVQQAVLQLSNWFNMNQNEVLKNISAAL